MFLPVIYPYWLFLLTLFIAFWQLSTSTSNFLKSKSPCVSLKDYPCFSFIDILWVVGPISVFLYLDCVALSKKYFSAFGIWNVFPCWIFSAFFFNLYTLTFDDDWDCFSFVGLVIFTLLRLHFVWFGGEIFSRRIYISGEILFWLLGSWQATHFSFFITSI
jgi:hypothetical protein